MVYLQIPSAWENMIQLRFNHSEWRISYIKQWLVLRTGVLPAAVQNDIDRGGEKECPTF